MFWTLKVVQSHLSFRNCANISKLFGLMFLDSEVSFKLPKCAYIINLGLRKISLKSINKSSLTLCFKIVKMMLILAFGMTQEILRFKFVHGPNATKLFDQLKYLIIRNT